MSGSSYQLLAESGATKTEWRRLYANGKVAAVSTKGYNPNVQNMEQIKVQLTAELPQVTNAVAPTVVHFYGAAFANLHYCTQMRSLLQELTDCQQVDVQHDMLAAARSVLQDQPGIVSILGTGSNCCAYDGHEIVATRGGHGYIFGDEGSGANIGLRLLKGLLDDEMSEELRNTFESFRHKSVLEERNYVYRAEKPNVVLSSYTTFVAKHLAMDEVRQLVRRSFDAFLLKTVMRLPQRAPLPLHFVGSVAKAFEFVLHDACLAQGLHIAGITASPIEGLVQYHLQHATPQNH